MIAINDRLTRLAAQPSSACATADGVVQLDGSTFSAIGVIVSNNVLNSVVTDPTSITSCESAAVENFGADSATYLLPVGGHSISATIDPVRLM